MADEIGTIADSGHRASRADEFASPCGGSPGLGGARGTRKSISNRHPGLQPAGEDADMRSIVAPQFETNR